MLVINLLDPRLEYALSAHTRRCFLCTRFTVRSVLSCSTVWITVHFLIVNIAASEPPTTPNRRHAH